MLMRLLQGRAAADGKYSTGHVRGARGEELCYAVAHDVTRLPKSGY